MGPGTRKWLQTDREGVSYHYHSKLGEVLGTGGPLAQGFKKKNLGFTLTLTILVLNLVCTCTARDKTRVSCDSVIDTTLNSPYFGSTIRIVPVPKMFHFSTTCVFSHMQYYGITTMRILSNFGDTTMRVT